MGGGDGGCGLCRLSQDAVHHHPKQEHFMHCVVGNTALISTCTHC